MTVSYPHPEAAVSVLPEQQTERPPQSSPPCNGKTMQVTQHGSEFLGEG